MLWAYYVEEIYGQALDQIFKMIFQPWGLTETGFGRSRSCATVRGVKDGQVHDPKARVLGIHAGSAGYFQLSGIWKYF